MTIRVTDDDGLRRITIDRPESKNALTPEMAAEIADALESSTPEEQYAVLIEGNGDAFSAGGDIKQMAAGGGDVRSEYERVAETFGRVVEAGMTADVPIVAKVDGDAIGAGLSLAALSDLAYAAEDARFSVAFVRVGLVPDTGGSVLLPHLIGLRETKRLALTGEFFDGREADEMGLVTEAVPADDLEEVVETALADLKAKPTRILGLIRETIHGGLGRDWRSALEHENQIQAQARDTDEHAQAVLSFLDR